MDIQNGVKKHVTTTVPQIAKQAEDIVIASRASRLLHEEKNKKRNIFQKFFSKSVGKVFKTIFEMIPFPGTWYDPGDVITLLSGVRGKDTLSGEHLDHVDRAIHFVAAVIPMVPATPFIIIARRIRAGVEETMYARKQGNLTDAAKSIKDALQVGKNMHHTIKGKK